MKRRGFVAFPLLLLAVLVARPARAQFAEAERLRGQGDYMGAIPLYEKVLAENPDDGRALFGIGVSHSALSAVEKKLEHLRDAHRYLKRAAEKHPENIDYRYYNGYWAIQLALGCGDEGEKSRLLQLAEGELRYVVEKVEDETKQESYKNTLVWILELEGKLAEAKPLLEELRATGAEANRKNYRDRLVQLLIKARLFGEAGKILEKILEGEPRDHQAWYWLGQAKSGLGDQAGAIVAHLESIRIKPDYTYPNSTLLNIYNRSVTDKKYKEGAALIDRILAVKPMPYYYAWACKYLAECRIGQNDLRGGIQALLEAEKIKPDEANFPNRLGLVYLAVGESAKGIDAFKRAIRLNPDLLYPYENMGSELALAGRVEEACKYFREGWIASGRVMRKPGQRADFKAEAEVYRSLFRWNLDQMEAYRKN